MGHPPEPDAERSAELLRRWQGDGDRDALDQLLRIEVALLREQIRRKGANLLSPSVSSSDVAQEAVLNFYKVRDAPTFEEPAALRAYLWRSALRLLARHAESAGRRDVELDAARSQAFATALATTGGFSAIDRSERDCALALALGLLEQSDREILECVYSRALTVEAAARELSITNEAAKKRVARARRRLAAKLGDWSELIG